MNDKKAIVLRDVRLRENALMKNVYLWMILGLAITELTSNLMDMAQMVMVLSSRVERLQKGTAAALFVGYSALTGLTLSSIFIAYTGTSIAVAFVSALSVFAGGAVYGAVTKKDLRSIGGYLTMGLFGLIIASLLNMLIGSSMLDFAVSVIGVVLFVGLTAWDSQRIADINATYGQEMTNEELTKIGILGALSLYLDFLNIFLYLLRIFGRSDSN